MVSSLSGPDLGLGMCLVLIFATSWHESFFSDSLIPRDFKGAENKDSCQDFAKTRTRELADTFSYLSIAMDRE